MPDGEALEVLAAAPAPVAAEAVRHMAPDRAASMLAGLERDLAVPVIERLNPDRAANILRRVEEETREALVGSLAAGSSRAVRTLLSFPEGTAGSLMNPTVLALPEDISAEEALAHMRKAPENVRYNLYVVDREQVLVGVLNLRELLLAGRKDLLRSIAHRDVRSISAKAGRHTILTHPAWRDARSVPVVDQRGVYLGAVRYQTMRRLEEELRGAEPESSAPTVEALGDLFSTGIASVFGALAASAVRPFPGGVKRES